jgi:hypothetical protein
MGMERQPSGWRSCYLSTLLAGLIGPAEVYRPHNPTLLPLPTGGE